MLNAKVDSDVDRYKERVERFSSSIDLSLFLHILVKSKYYLVLFLILIFTSAFLYLRYAQPIYESKSKLQVNDNNDANKILELNQIEANNNKIAEAMELIRSKKFMERVVSKLQIEASYFIEGTFKSDELYMNSPYKVNVKLKDESLYNRNFYITFLPDLSGGEVTYPFGAATKTVKFFTNSKLLGVDFDMTVYLNNDFEKNKIAEAVKSNKCYFVLRNIDVVTSELQSKVDIKLLSDLAKTILITVKDPNAKKSKDIVNSVANEYLAYDVERKSQSSEKILSFIDGQLEMVFKDLKGSEDNLQKFKKERKVDEKDVVITANMVRYSNLEDQMIRMEMEQKMLDEIQQNISNNKNIDTYQLVSLLAGSEDEGSIKEVITNIQRLLVEKENLLFQVTAKSTQVDLINKQIDIQKQLLLRSLDAVRVKYKNRYKNLSEKAAEYKYMNDSRPEDEVELARLMRVYSISEKYYTMLLEKKTEYSIAKSGFVSQNIILESAMGAGALVSPSRKTAISVALISFILACLIFVLGRYFIHDKITSLNEIIRHTSASINTLGIIPKFDKNIPVSQLIVDKNPKALIAEAFRTIRTNLQFINNTEGPKVISITSTISGEGKTFVAINIAGILAFSGKKVVIIDLDMRKPKIHRGFEVSNDKGMSTILTNITTVDECFHESSMQHLKFITAGPIPPNPSELIMSTKLLEVVQYLKTKFDYVVIDNPPVGLVTDGLLTLRHADYPIYVFRAEYSRKNFAQIIDRLRNENSIQHLSIVLNGVDIKKSNYGYNYGYGYGYGYGNDN